eukprot:g4245.t1
MTNTQRREVDKQPTEKEEIDKTQPSPQEKRESTLVLVVFSLFFVLCLIAWYFTSRVYRAQLPAVSAFARHRTARFDQVVSFSLILLTNDQSPLPESSLEVQAERIKNALPADSEPSLLLNALQRQVNASLVSSLLAQEYPEGVDTALALHQLHMAHPVNTEPTHVHLSFFYVCDDRGVASSQVWHLGQFQHGWRFASCAPPTRTQHAQQTQGEEGQEVTAWAIADLVQLLRLVHPAQSGQDTLRVPSLTHYTLCFSLVNARPNWQQGWRTWHFQAAADKLLLPFLQKLSPVFTSELESQVVHFASLGERVERWEEGGLFYVTPTALQDFVGSTQWNVVSPLASATLDFMVYIPDTSQAPLYILDGSAGNVSQSHLRSSFLVPGWGGVLVVQPDPTAVGPDGSNRGQPLSPAEMREVFSVFVGQLRRICGLLPLPASNDYVLLPSPSGITDWEEAWLVRQRLTENIAHATESLSSLYELLDGVPQMPVADHMRDHVASAVDQLAQATRLMEEGKEREAMRASRNAVDAAQKAFFDPSMLPLLYFPDEHLYAVYAPFFVPVLFPILAAWVRLLKSLHAPKTSTDASTDPKNAFSPAADYPDASSVKGSSNQAALDSQKLEQFAGRRSAGVDRVVPSGSDKVVASEFLDPAFQEALSPPLTRLRARKNKNR